MARNDPPALLCLFPGCRSATRERKPYCSEHVSQHPYVNDLLVRLREVEHELARVRSRGARAVELDGVPAQEILRELETFGQRTVERLARDLRLDVDLVAAYARALSRAGRVDLGVTSRGVTCLKLRDAVRRVRTA